MTGTHAGRPPRLTIDRTRLASGGSLEANVKMRHLGRDPIRWRAGGREVSALAVVP